MPKPIFILGFDGLSPRFWRDVSLLPTGTQYHGVLKSVEPPISPAAWCSLITGVDPEQHGVTRWRQEGWVPKLPISGHSMVHPLWLGRHETFALVNVPCVKPKPLGPGTAIFPPQAFNVTTFVGGLLWGNDEYYAKPHTLYKRLQRADYIVDNNGWDDKPAEWRKSDGGLDWLLEAARYRRMIDTPEADVTIIVYTFPDRMSHAAWSDAGLIKRMHRAVQAEAQFWLEDRHVNETHQWAIISDHGFQGYPCEDYLAMLKDQGDSKPKWFEGCHHPDGVFMSNCFDLRGKSIKDVLLTALEAR